jgi:formylglycine-generating enzyme required for sulfatase activity
LAREKEAQEREQREKAEAERRRVEVERQAREEAERSSGDAELARRLSAMFEMVKVPGGSFQMGAADITNATPVHEVQLDSFLIGRYPVTQEQWVAVMGSNPSHFKTSIYNPVEQVSYDDVQRFISRLNQLTGRNYRLPTEAEWEYAARSGGKNETWAGTSSESDLVNFAWFLNNSGKTTHPVGMKNPNGLGIYDMSGNVWEWCSDWYDPGYYRFSPVQNPQGPSTGSGRVDRGGGWSFGPSYARASDRGNNSPGLRINRVGFRLVAPVQ